MTRSKTPRSVFVVCEAGTDLRVLVEILRDLGLQTLNFDNDLVSGRASTNTAQELIATADLVCAVLQESNTPQVYLELGYALGRRQAVAIISEAVTLPSALRDLLWIKASLTDRVALKFQLQAFIANLDANRSMRSTKPPKSAKRSISDKKLISLGPPASRMERELLWALEGSVEIDSIASQPGGDVERGYIPDFAVWLTAQPKFIESPMVIEVKGGQLGQKAIDRAVEQLETFARAGNVRTGLLIVSKRPNRALRLASLSPLIFVLDLDEARQLLAEGNLVETLRRERNRVAHSAN